MPRETAVPLIDGDICHDGNGNVGSARKSFNRQQREYFIGVFIIEGPDKGGWAKKKWEFIPDLHMPGGTLNATCGRCDRPFLSRSRVLGDLGGYTVARDTRCRTCAGLQTAPRPARESEDYVGSMDHRTEHHAK